MTAATETPAPPKRAFRPSWVDLFLWAIRIGAIIIIAWGLIGTILSYMAGEGLTLDQWRALLISTLVQVALAGAAQAQAQAWETCRGADGPTGPVLSDCRPLDGPIDPQGRELWLRATVEAPDDQRPRALHVAGTVSTRAWLNGQLLGANGRPAVSAAGETPGRYQAALPIRESLWRPAGNVLVVQLSSFHGGPRLDQPVGALVIAPWPLPSSAPLLAVMFAAAGALLAAGFGFGVIHAIRRTGSSLTLAAMARAREPGAAPGDFAKDFETKIAHVAQDHSEFAILPPCKAIFCLNIVTDAGVIDDGIALISLIWSF